MLIKQKNSKFCCEKSLASDCLKAKGNKALMYKNLHWYLGQSKMY